MRWILIWAALLCGSANAQMMQAAVNGKKIAPSYVGPGDIVSGALGWWGLRAYNAAFAASGTSKAINITRASDSTSVDIAILTTGKLDTATAATFCAATTCTIPVMYDQTGNGHNLTPTFTAPTLTFNCVNTNLPCVNHIVATDSFDTSTPVLASSATVSAVGLRNSSVLVHILVNGSYNGIKYMTTTDTVLLSVAGNNITATAVDSSWHALHGVMDSTSTSYINVDGVSGTPAATVGGNGNGPLQMGDPATANLAGKWGEKGWWDGIQFSSGQLSSMHTNQSAYWGTP